MWQTTTYREHTIRSQGKYKCECGYKFTRIASSGWTENPFNKLWLEGKVNELNEECRQENKRYLAEKKCPKCGVKCFNKDDYKFNQPV